MPGTLSLPPRVSDPDMHHGTCVTHVPWCMPGSLTGDVFWSRWRVKRSRHSRRMRNSKFCVSGKRPIIWRCGICNIIANFTIVVATQAFYYRNDNIFKLWEWLNDEIQFYLCKFNCVQISFHPGKSFIYWTAQFSHQTKIMHTEFNWVTYVLFNSTIKIPILSISYHVNC